MKRFGIVAAAAMALLLSACGELPSNGIVQVGTDVTGAGAYKGVAGDTAVGAFSGKAEAQYVPQTGGPGSAGGEAGGKALLAGTCGGNTDAPSALMVSKGDAGVGGIDGDVKVSIAGSKSTGWASRIVAGSLYAAAADSDDGEMPGANCPELPPLPTG